MQKDILLPDEKIINFRKPSILGESKFWLGAIVLALSVVTFVVFSVLYPQYNSTLSNLYGYLRPASVDLIIIFPRPSSLSIMPTSTATSEIMRGRTIFASLISTPCWYIIRLFVIVNSLKYISNSAYNR